MTIKTGPMELLMTEPTDVIEDYVNGLQPDGGEWTNWSRLSQHDHSGGLLGNQVAVTIPDGSITTPDLDPSVLAPYALTDGSKPFTGQVTMQADAVVRDRLFFGEQGTALPPDASLTRTAAGVLALGGALSGPAGTAARLAIGANGTLSLTPDAGPPAVEASGGVLTRGASGGYVLVARNDAAKSWQWYATNGGAFLHQQWDSPPFAGTRLAVSPSGTLSLTPDAAQDALKTDGTISGVSGTSSWFRASIFPTPDNTHGLGYSGARFTGVWATSGVVSSSLAEAKQAITPLSPEDALAAVRATDPVVFDYRPPERGPEWYELPDDPEQAEAILLQRLTAAPLEAGARHQAGFILRDETGTYTTDPLFETGDGQSNAANSVGILIAAMQAIDARLTALEGA